MVFNSSNVKKRKEYKKLKNEISFYIMLGKEIRLYKSTTPPA
jgi:hypothetical protein